MNKESKSSDKILHNFTIILLATWKLVSGRNKIVSSCKSMISPFTSRHVTKLWQSCEKICDARFTRKKKKWEV